jgi:para-nitrobenzyl esterase
MTGAAHIELETPFGRLRGARSEGVAAFRRVPYAEAPVGARRLLALAGLAALYLAI